VNFELALSACTGCRFVALDVPLLFLGIGVPPETEYGSIECYNVAPIRDPGLDREQTNTNVSPPEKKVRTEGQVVVDRERRAGEKRDRLDANHGRCCGVVILPVHCYALPRMRPQSMSYAEGFLVISCGKVEYEKSS
jgi:hypothetical protein